MNKSISARRVPRKIGNDPEDEEQNDAGSDSVSDATVKRPVIKPRKSSSLRTSFQTNEPEESDDSPSSGVVTPKRGGALSRLAVHRNASKRASLLSSQLSPRDVTSDTDAQPSYTPDALQELKASTPSTPRTTVDTIADDTQALDLTSKFGTSLTRYTPSGHNPSIPSAAEIAEKKSRRARLAKEQAAEEYISLDPDDPGLDDSDQEVDAATGRLVLKPKKDKWGLEESRLVRDDEDIMENFEEFTEDGRVHLGKDAEVEAKRRRREDMERRIREMQEGGSEEEVEERNAVFEEAQTRHGMFGGGNLRREAEEVEGRPRTPKIISPLPTLDGAVERLKRQMGELQADRAEKLRAIEELQREKIWLAEEEVRIQKALRETAAKFKAMREEKGIEVGEEQSVVKQDSVAISSADVNADDDYDDDARNGLGIGNHGAGLDFVS